MRAKSISEIKTLARHSLHRRYGAFGGLFLAAFFLQNIIVSIPSVLFDAPKNVILYLSQILLTVLLEALGSMIAIGLNRSALQLVRGKQFGFGDLFFAFRNQTDHFLALELILTAINTFTGIPGLLYVWMNNDVEVNILTFTLLTMAFSALSSLLTFLITLVFSMSEFLMLDDPNMTAGESLRYSMQLIRGNVGRYLMLNISFIGYLILGFLSGMIAFLWIGPYILVSHALFYEDLCDLEEARYLNEG